MAGEPMRALSVQQPYTGCIVLSDKRAENRTKPAPRWIIGQQIALHASKAPSWFAPLIRWTAAGLKPPQLTGISRARWCRDNAHALGRILAVVTVTGCHHSDECMLPEYAVPAGGRTGCSPWAVRGQWHIDLADVRPLAEPVPCNGALGWWPLPEDVEKAVRAQLEGSAGA